MSERWKVTCAACLLAGVLLGIPQVARGNAVFADAPSPSVAVGPKGHAVTLFKLRGHDPQRAFAQPNSSFDGVAPLRGLTGDFFALGVDADGSAYAVVDSVTNGHSRVALQVAPPGGDFGPIQVLSEHSFPQQARIATNARGDVLVAWQEWRSDALHLASSYKAKDGVFSPMRVHGPIAGLYDLLLEDDGRATALVAIRDAPGASERPAVFEGGAGSLAGPRSLREEFGRGGALATGRGGSVLALTLGPYPQLFAQRRTAGGDWSAPIRLAADRAYLDSQVVGAVDPDGTAWAGWSGAGVFNSRFSFDQPPPNAVAVTLNGNPVLAARAGSGVAAAGRLRYPAVASYRPPGGVLGPPFRLAEGEVSAAPAVAVAPNGRAIAVWMRSDDVTREVLERRFDANGQDPPRVIASAPAFPVDKPQRKLCASNRGLIRRSRFGAVRKVDRDNWAVCSTETGHYRPLSVGNFLFRSTPRIVGHTYAVGYVGGEDVGTSPYLDAQIEVADIRTGEGLAGYAEQPRGPSFGEKVVIGSLRLTEDGSVAVITCKVGDLLDQAGSIDRLVARRCRRPGAPNQVWVVDDIEARPRVIDRGRAIDPRSLRISGRTISWRHGERRRSYRLRRRVVPGL